MDNHIRALRSARGWTQADLAAHLDVSRQTINALETGKYDPSLPLAFRIAYLFGQPIESIFIDPSRPAVFPGAALAAAQFEYQSRATTALSELALLHEMGQQGWELTEVGLGKLDFRRPVTLPASAWLYQRLGGRLSEAQKNELVEQGWQFVSSQMGVTFHYFKRPLS